jgi:NAD(P)-dependent dehydrogenase (short-subunit alcohol dehydrogenase family)
MDRSTDDSSSGKTPAEEVVAEIKALGSDAVANYDSVASWEGAENIIKTATDSFGKLDILVNNAGITRERMVFNMTEEEWDAVIKVHLYGHFYCTRHAATLFRQQKSGRIINTSSHAGLGAAGQANYAAAKEGIVGFTRTVAREMGRYNVTCNAIRPRAATRMTMNEAVKEIRIKQLGEEKAAAYFKEQDEVFKPEAVGTFVAYLASDHAENINCCVFELWGGHIAIYDDPPEIAKPALDKKGFWTVEELVKTMPDTLAKGKVRELPPFHLTI